MLFKLKGNQTRERKRKKKQHSSSTYLQNLAIQHIYFLFLFWYEKTKQNTDCIIFEIGTRSHLVVNVLVPSCNNQIHLVRLLYIKEESICS